jgi:hypothetical protein
MRALPRPDSSQSPEIPGVACRPAAVRDHDRAIMRAHLE